ncbi:MAG TPA: hypothetical protein VN428_27075 [Bryobacteraceae bacterium]|nr:hypothetical protein [Bryobacteraceae bacterium]
MRVLLSFLLILSSAVAQIPTDTLTVKRWERDTLRKKFLRENPGATEIIRLPETIHFKLPPIDPPQSPDPFGPPQAFRPTHHAIFGKGLSHVDAVSNEIVPTEQEVWEISTGGYRTVGGPVTIRIIDGARGSSVIEVYGPTGRSFKLNPSRTTYLGENKFTLEWESLTWTVELGTDGWAMASSEIAVKRGAHIYQAPYIQSLVSLTMDAATGDLVGDGGERLTRAQMVGADGISRPCSAWSLTTKVMSFTCDDSALPPEAFPYKVDPTYSAVAPNTSVQDCYQVYRVGSDHLPGTLVACDSFPFGPADGLWALGFGYWYRYDNAAFFRYNTSSIPTAATITSGNFKVFPGQQGYSEYMAVPVYWWDYANAWPPVAADRAEQPTKQWPAGSLGPLGTKWTTFQWYTIPLNANFDRVRKGPGAYTAVKVGGGNLYYPNSRLLDFYGPWGYGTRHSGAPILELTYNNLPQNVSATPANGTITAGNWTTFTATYRDPDGYADLNDMRLLAAYGIDAGYSCYVRYMRGENLMYLLRDDTASWVGSGSPGSGGVQSNSQCDLDVAASSASCSGTDCTINWRVRFKPTFTYGGMTKHTYTWVYDTAMNGVGWADWGAWTLMAGGPKLIVVTE